MEEEIARNLTSLEEMILDEEKLVTYLSLSKDLCIHVNLSKDLLNKFLEKKCSGQENRFNVSFIVSGVTHDGQGRTTVCSSDNLTKVEKEMKLVYFKHIYSISVGAKVDNVAHTLVHKFEDFSLCVGLVRNNNCTKRDIQEMSKLKSNSHDLVTGNTSSLNLNKIKQEQKSVTNKESESLFKVQNNSASENGIKVEKVKSEILSPKKSSVSPKKATSPKTTSKIQSKPQKGIAGFFSKQNGINGNVNKNKTDIKSEKKEDVKPIPEAIKMDVDDTIPKEIPRETVKKNDNNINKTKENKNTKKTSQIRKTAKVDKKRKRLLHVSDSDSDGDKDPFADEEPTPEVNLSDDEIPPTPNVNVVKVTSGIVNPKKKRKIVDKTYTDEDGYILTKKEEVYESCSDNDEDMCAKENIANDVPVKKEVSPKSNKVAPAAKISKKKISPPQKGKQATMMNFFKKK